MSVAEDIAGRLADGDVVIIDGGTGTQLQAEGVPMDDVAWSGRANLDHGDVLQRVHEAYIRAGADVIIANTFAANRAALEPAGLGGRVADANRNAVAAALRAREAAADGRAVAVAGSMSPFCSVGMQGRGEAGADRFPSLADFREQAGLLAEAGVDLIALELIEAASYGRNALQAAAETGLPIWLGFAAVRLGDGTVGADPVLGEGDTFAELVSKLADPALAAVTMMHAKPDVIGEAVDIISGQFAGPIGVYAESGDWAAPEWVFNGLTPDEYLQEAVAWADRGVQLIGGCCGIGPDHIRLLADRLPRQARLLPCHLDVLCIGRQLEPRCLARERSGERAERQGAAQGSVLQLDRIVRQTQRRGLASHYPALDSRERHRASQRQVVLPKVSYVLLGPWFQAGCR